MGRIRVQRRVIICKCGCGKEKVCEPSETKAQFYNREHYNKWLVKNPRTGQKKKPRVKDEGDRLDKIYKPKRVLLPTGQFPMFL